MVGFLSACLLVGDSIALMLAPYLPCTVDAKIGIPTRQIVRRAHPAPLVVISAGSNDVQGHYVNPHLKKDLEDVRLRVDDGRVVFVLPVDGRARQVVGVVAAQHGDKTVAFQPGRDRVHPRCPRCLAEKIRHVVSNWR